MSQPDPKRLLGDIYESRRPSDAAHVAARDRGIAGHGVAGFHGTLPLVQRPGTLMELPSRRFTAVWLQSVVDQTLALGQNHLYGRLT